MSRSDKPKILMLTGIFYPDVGGPAIHVRNISDALVRSGYRVCVITYGDNPAGDNFTFKVRRVSRKLNPIFRFGLYLFYAFQEAMSSRLIYAFNVSTAGLPTFLIGKLLRIKTIIRVPGDPIWERIVERGDRFVSFINYYRQGFYLKDRPVLFKVIKFILPEFDKLIFYSPFLRDVYVKYYNVPGEKTEIIYNPIPKSGHSNNDNDTILFAGRFVSYKNLPLVIRAFDKARQRTGKGKLLLVGNGPDERDLRNLISGLESREFITVKPSVGQEELFDLIRECRFGIGPALTEFNPNFILECLSMGKPVLISRENGLSVKLSEEMLFNALDENELAQKMIILSGEEDYKKVSNFVSTIDMSNDWEKVIDAHMSLIKRMT